MQDMHVSLLYYNEDCKSKNCTLSIVFMNILVNCHKEDGRLIIIDFKKCVIPRTRALNRHLEVIFEIVSLENY